VVFELRRTDNNSILFQEVKRERVGSSHKRWEKRGESAAVEVHLVS